MKSVKIPLLFAPMFVVLALAGCGGGGGGTVPPPPFSSWSNVTANSTVEIPALSQEVSYTSEPNTGPVLTVSDPSAVSTTSSFTGTFDANRELSKFTISTPPTTVSFDTSAGDTISSLTPEVLAAVNPAGSNVALIANPFGLGWDYQTFGVWETGRGTGSGTAGAMSAGATPAFLSIPTTGTATFLGNTGGIYVDPAGLDYLTAADLTVSVNWLTRSLDFTTTNTTLYDPADLSSFTNADLNLSGTLNYLAGSNSFSGTLSTTGRPLTGNSTGQFYGPNGEELGGVFFLKAASGVETFGGAYGAKR